MCQCQNMRSDTMGMSEIPGYVPPWVSGGGGVGGHVVDPNTMIGDGGGYYDWNPTPSPAVNNTPQTMAEALTPVTTTTVADGTLSLQIDQQTLLIAAAVAIGLFFFAAK